MALVSSAAKLAIGKQSGRGTPATTFRQFEVIENNLRANKNVEERALSTEGRTKRSTSYVSSIEADGTFTILATPSSLAYLIYLWCGVDVLGVETDEPYTHTISLTNQSQPWITLISQRGATGSAESIVERYSDSKISQLVVTSSAGEDITVEITPASLNPGEKFTYPTSGVTIDKEPRWLHSEFCNNIEVDNVVLNGTSEVTLTFGQEGSNFMGACVTPYDIADGIAGVTIATAIMADQLSLDLYNKIQYLNTVVPSGTDVSKEQFYASVKMKLERGVASTTTERSFEFDFPNVSLIVEDMPDYDFENAERVTFGFGGTAEADENGILFTGTAKNEDDSAY